MTESDTDDPALILEPADVGPAIHVHVNPLYVLYHCLVQEGKRSRQQRNPRTAEAAGRAAQARHLTGVHGIWDIWERTLAQSGAVDDAIRGISVTMTETVAQLGSALRATETEFRERVWPERQEAIGAAMTGAPTRRSVRDLPYWLQVAPLGDGRTIRVPHSTPS